MRLGKKSLKTSKTVVKCSVALSPSHRSGCLLFPVQCWSSPLQWMCEIAAYWQERENTNIHVDPEHSKQAQWVTCVSIQAIQELGCFQLPGMVFTSWQHGAVCYHVAT